MSSRQARTFGWLVLALAPPAWAVGCSVEEIDLTGKSCPCADGYLCDGKTQTCRKVDASGGANTGGASTGGASTGGANTGGANTGGASTGGASTGGASTGGTSTGGTGTGGTSTSGSGGTGGTGTGGVSTGGSGGTGTGGGTGAGITCGNSSCPVSTQKCCHTNDSASAAGSCAASATTCASGFVDMFCDGPSDCGSGKVCCERLGGGASLNSIKCEDSVDQCKPLGAGSAALVCAPASPSCPTGKSCVQTPRGYSRCE